MHSPLINLVERLDGAWVFQLRRDFFASRRDELLAVAQVTLALMKYGHHIVKQGRGEGSLESDDTAGLDYRVVTGDVIRDRLPWLFDLYRSPSVCESFSRAVGVPLIPSTETRSAVNLNMLSKQGSRYERHVDGQGFSAVLMITDMLRMEGGELVIYPEGRKPLDFLCAFGKIVLFDGSKTPHEVLALKSSRHRITAPMVYLPPGVTPRPATLNDYLYQ